MIQRIKTMKTILRILHNKFLYEFGVINLIIGGICFGQAMAFIFMKHEYKVGHAFLIISIVMFTTRIIHMIVYLKYKHRLMRGYAPEDPI